MRKNPTLTTEAGAPVADNQHSQLAGPGGPTVLQDHHLIEKLARFNRERIPERVVHAVATAAHGYLEVTSAEVPTWTKMKVSSAVGKRTPVFARFSTVAGSRGAADTARDPRGFALKFYTEDGNWDLAGNNTPIFFIRDGIKFDLTKVWPYNDYPLIAIGKMVLDRVPENYFAEVDQAAFDPRHQPHPPAGERSARCRGWSTQVRSRRCHAIRRQRWPREELRTQQPRWTRSPRAR